MFYVPFHLSCIMSHFVFFRFFFAFFSFHIIPIFSGVSLSIYPSYPVFSAPYQSLPPAGDLPRFRSFLPLLHPVSSSPPTFYRMTFIPACYSAVLIFPCFLLSRRTLPSQCPNPLSPKIRPRRRPMAQPFSWGGLTRWAASWPETA
jgi:hypothetical protein